MAHIDQDDKPKPQIVLQFLTASELFGTYGENYGRSYGCLTPSSDDWMTSLSGFVVQQAEYTRERWNSYRPGSQNRTFKPGLLISHEGKDYKAPDISFQQYSRALATAPALPNGVVLVELDIIQKANRDNKNFVGRKVNANEHSCCML
ncbi:MAG: hypothetical protein PHE27_04295 [Alphaproteobacteria bacterium]|nr:hypothetical protein [Alphaproteobacteria bacterium]